MFGWLLKQMSKIWVGYLKPEMYFEDSSVKYEFAYEYEYIPEKSTD